jgi:hypothetical protein
MMKSGADKRNDHRGTTAGAPATQPQRPHGIRIRDATEALNGGVMCSADRLAQGSPLKTL